jgi:hypothetical protein
VSEFAREQVTASMNRALWGEVTGHLRWVQFRTAGRHIDLRFLFGGVPGDDDRDAMGAIGAEVAADFADATVCEEAIGTGKQGLPASQPGWHVVYARKEPSLAR